MGQDVRHLLVAAHALAHTGAADVVALPDGVRLALGVRLVAVQRDVVLVRLPPGGGGLAVDQPVAHQGVHGLGVDRVHLGRQRVQVGALLRAQAGHHRGSLGVGHARQTQPLILGAREGLHALDLGQPLSVLGHGLLEGLGGPALRGGALQLQPGCLQVGLGLQLQRVDLGLAGVALGHRGVGLGRVTGVQELLERLEVHPLVLQGLQQRAQLVVQEALGAHGQPLVEQLLAQAHVVEVADRPAQSLDALLHAQQVDEPVLELVAQRVPGFHAGEVHHPLLHGVPAVALYRAGLRRRVGADAGAAEHGHRLGGKSRSLQGLVERLIPAGFNGEKRLVSRGQPRVALPLELQATADEHIGRHPLKALAP